MHVAATTAGVVRALHAVRAFAGRCALSEAATNRLALVIDEWLANAVEHGQPPAGSRLVLRLSYDATCVRLAATDAGSAFDPRSAVFEGPNPERGGGVGLELVRTWAAIEHYRRRRGRNHVVLRVPTETR